MPPPSMLTGASIDDRLGSMSTQELERVAEELGVNVQSLKGSGVTTGPQYGTTEGQGFMERMMAGFKSTPKEKMDYWRKMLGDENVSASQEGEILWKHPQKGWQQVDPAGFDSGDIADFVGDVPELVGQLLASRVPGGSFIRGAVGSTGGNVVKQGIEQALPGKSEVSAGELGMAAVGGGVSEKIGQVVAPLITRGPTEMVRNKIVEWLTRNVERGEGLGSPFAKESMRLSQKFDIPLTASQITQGPFEKTLAGYAARSPFGIAAFERHETGAQRKAAEAAQRLLDRFGPRFSEADLGAQVRKALESRVAELENTLFRTAEKDFAFLDRALGGREVIPASHLQTFLEREGQKYSARDMPLDAQRLGNRLLKEAGGIPEGKVSARALKERLNRLANASYGKEPLFDSIDFAMDKGGQMRIAKEAYQALLRDLDEAAGGSNALLQDQGPVARLLRQARDNYNNNLAPIDEVRKSTLSRFGYSPATQSKGVEHMAQWFLKPMRTPSEVRNALEIISAVDPSLSDNLTRYLIEQAVVAGKEGGKGTLGAFSRKHFAEKLPRPEILEALHPGDPRKGGQIAGDIGDLSELVARSLWQGGQRPVLQESPYKTMGSVVSQETMFGKARALLERVLTPQAVARFETDPEARAAIYSIVKRLESGEPMTKAMETTLERLLSRGIQLGLYEGGSLANQSQQKAYAEPTP